MPNYGFVKTVAGTLEEVEQRVRAALDSEKFGVLVRIDMAAKLREKLAVDMDEYVILGACNPPNAHKAVTLEPDIGLLLPCNVIIYRKGNETVVGIIRPTVAMQMVDNQGLREVADAVEQKLKRVFDAL
jgi:uncharacterized protein (DUF302 family)